MKLKHEPKHIDFYVIDKPWTSEGKKEFSALIEQIKSLSKRKRASRKGKVRLKAA